MENKKRLFHQFVTDLQNQITEEMKKFDTGLVITEDIWKRNDFLGAPGGGGITRAFKGSVFESAGVNTSCIFGAVDPKFSAKLQGEGDSLWAAGISLILHPRNPHVPTIHANFRMIQKGEKTWFGGGVDLTPFIPHEEDFIYFHSLWKKVIAPYGHYEAWKKWCDEYFTNHHRNGEMRGIGGFFYDYFSSGDVDHDQKMVFDIAGNFISSYFPIVAKRVNQPWSDEDNLFQEYRHGRYVEFNLLHDRGTHFGLQTNGRTESILISLPARCRFGYQYAPPKGSIHEKMMQYYYPRDWTAQAEQ